MSDPTNPRWREDDLMDENRTPVDDWTADALQQVLHEVTLSTTARTVARTVVSAYLGSTDAPEPDQLVTALDDAGILQTPHAELNLRDEVRRLTADLTAFRCEVRRLTADLTEERDRTETLTARVKALGNARTWHP